MDQTLEAKQLGQQCCIFTNMYQQEKMDSRFWILVLAMLISYLPLSSQCDENHLINPGFETVGPPCGTVPPGGLINGSFNQGCMIGWEAAWGTPSVCSNNPSEGDYYACLGANNEGFFQTLILSTDSTYCLSFYFRSLNAGSGDLDVYLASGLVNQPIGNSGIPPITVLPSWQLLGSFPSTSNQWVQIIIPSFMQLDPANTQLLFLNAPTGGLDVGVDDVKLSTPEILDPNVEVDIACANQSVSTFTFEGSLNPFPPGFEEAQWAWSFGDGQSGTGQVVTHTYAAFGEYELCLTVFLECGCDFTGCITFSYNACTCTCSEDIDPPQFVNFNPGPYLVFCLEDIPVAQPPEITDCDQGAFLLLEESETGPPCNRVINYTWIAADLCGNTAAMSQVIIYEDTLPPVFTAPPVGLNIPCPDYLPEFLLWINDFGGASVSDECGVVNLSVEYDSTFSGSCGEILVDFIATDECGHQTSMQAVFRYTDTNEPELVQLPQDLVLTCSGAGLDEVVQWLDTNGGASVIDACGNVTFSNDFSGTINEDTTEVLFVAEDLCFNVLSFSALIIQTDTFETVLDTMYTCDIQSAGIDTSFQVNQFCSLQVITNRMFIPADLIFDSMLVCDPLLAVTDTTFFVNQYGCDSLFIRTAVLAASDTIRMEMFTCDPLLAGIDTVYFTNRFGCDSLHILTSVLTPSDTIEILTFTCDMAAVSTDTMHLVGANGCDSVVISAVLFSGDQYIVEDEIVLCGQGVNFSDTLQIQADPCDSIFITNYRFIPLDTTLLTTRVCSPADTGTFSMVLPGINGCDSIILMTNMYVPADTLLEMEYVCFGPDTMVEVVLLIDQIGCDSLFLLYYQVNVNPDTQFVQNTSCDTALAGISIETIPGQYCDTVLQIETLWLPALISRDTQWLCVSPQVPGDTFYYISSLGCDSLFIIQYLQNSLQINVLTKDETCMGLADASILATSVDGGLPPYVFSFNGGPFDTIMEWSSLSPGEFILVAEDAAMCRDTLAGIILEAGPPYTVDAGPDVLATKGEVIPIQIDSGVEWSSVLWEAFDPVVCPTCPVTSVGPINQEQYVYAAVTNTAGCTSIDSFRVFLSEVLNYYVPNIFSPNLDGINDYFFLSGSGPTLSTYEMSIFDRWGSLLFEAKEISINDSTAGWDGYFRGSILNPGVYPFIIKINQEGQGSEIIAGNVTLVR
ncbi:MAG: gliding motility-associated C-terminal domain-containing protein [Saprospiraceae bacterium]|nr:gliding motility-associated C-terminal domain-containing protein [Candidatus Opimibacter skivensis]